MDLELVAERVTIVLSHQIAVNEKSLPPLILRRIKQDLTIGKPGGDPEKIQLFGNEEGWLTLPRGYGGILIKCLHDSFIKYNLIDNRLILPEVFYGSCIKLSDNHEAAVSAMVIWKQGGVIVPCETDRIQITLEAMARIGQPALWIINNGAEQLVEQACQAFDMAPRDIGMIRNGEFRTGEKLTVCDLHALPEVALPSLRDQIGAIFIDEAFHLNAQNLFNIVGQFPAKYRLWTSSVQERDDRQTKAVFAAAGGTLQKGTSAIVPEYDK